MLRGKINANCACSFPGGKLYTALGPMFWFMVDLLTIITGSAPDRVWSSITIRPPVERTSSCWFSTESSNHSRIRRKNVDLFSIGLKWRRSNLNPFRKHYETPFREEIIGGGMSSPKRTPVSVSFNLGWDGTIIKPAEKMIPKLSSLFNLFVACYYITIKVSDCVYNCDNVFISL